MGKMIAVEAFCKNHSISVNNIYVARNIGQLPKSIFNEESKKRMLIDEGYLLRRKEFIKKVWNESHNNYFLLIKHIPQGEIARLLSVATSKTKESWSVFISNHLFNSISDEILRLKVPQMLWLWWRFTNWIIKYLFRKIKIHRKIRDKDKVIDYMYR